MSSEDFTTRGKRLHAMRLGWIALCAFALVLLMTVSGAIPGGLSRAQAQEEEVGQRGPSFGAPDNTLKPTRDKPQSKLWFNDGTWWASMFEPTAGEDGDGAYTIHRYDEGSDEGWSDTGTLIDERNNSRADTLSDGEDLYIATAGTRPLQAPDSAQVLRYSYDEATGEYTRDEGFPVRVSDGGMEAIVLDKDTNGRLWVTYTQLQRQTDDPDSPEGQVFVNHSLEDESKWDEPFVPPVDGTDISRDDISALVSYDLNTEEPQIGVMWSNQKDDAIYFASHRDDDGDLEWDPSEKVIDTPNDTDDHINIKSLQSDDSGRVFAAFKTEQDKVEEPPDNSNAPQVYLTELKHGGEFENHVFGRVRDQHTRPNVLIDSENNDLYLFATAPTGGGAIFYKKSPLSDINFEEGENEGRGTPLIRRSSDPEVNDPTSTKQSIDSETDLMALAADDSTGYYLYNDLEIANSDTTAPTVETVRPEDGASGVAANSGVEADFSEEMDDETLTDQTFTLRRGDTPVPSEVTYDAYTETAILTPEEDLASAGSYTATIKGGEDGATDSAGNPLESNESWSFTTADTEAPETTIDSGPEGAVNSDSATFRFSSSEEGSTFECSLDGDAFVECDSPKEYENLEDGDHTFAVRAIDASDNTGEPASRNFTVDSAAPTVEPINPKPGSFVGTRTPVIEADVSDDQQDLSKADIELFVSGKAIPGSEFTYDQDTDRLTHEARRLPLGERDVRIVATDGAGSRQSEVWHFTVDVVKPTVKQINPKPGSFVGTRTPVIEADVLDNQQDLSKANIKLFVSGKAIPGSEFTYDQDTDRLTHEARRLPLGERDVRIVVTDNAGNRQSKVWRFTVDIVKPAIGQLSPSPGSSVRTHTPYIKAVVTDRHQELAKNDIKLRVAGKLATGFTYNQNTDRIVYKSQRLPAGKRGVKIIATDDAGNQNVRTWFFRVR